MHSTELVISTFCQCNPSAHWEEASLQEVDLKEAKLADGVRLVYFEIGELLLPENHVISLSVMHV